MNWLLKLGRDVTRSCGVGKQIFHYGFKIRILYRYIYFSAFDNLHVPTVSTFRNGVISFSEFHFYFEKVAIINQRRGKFTLP